MNVTVINHNSIRYNYRDSYQTYKAYTELEKYYGPYEIFHKVTTFYRSSYELPSYIGKGVYSDIDLMIKKINRNMGNDPNLSKSLFGGGKGNTYSKLYISTLGEMFERIIGAFTYYTYKDQLIFGSYKELKEKYPLMPPENIQIFAKEQFTDDFHFQPFQEDTKIRWVKGENLINHKEIYVPAQLIFIYYPMDTKDEQKIGYATSGGLSLHDNRELALFHGITECIERDEINLRWYDKIPPEKIDYEDLDNLSVYGKTILESKEAIGKEVDSFYHNMDIHEIPVVTAVSFDEELKKFSFCAGGGSSDSIEGSVESAFREYGQSELNLRNLFYCPSWYSSRAMIELFGFEDFDLDNMTLFYEIVPYYGLKKNRHLLDWYLRDNQTKFKPYIENTENNKGYEECYNKLIEVLKKYNINPIIFDFTPKGFAYIRLMKSFIPELSFAFLPNAPCLGNHRFYDVAYKNGYVDHILTYEELNKEALPFP